MYAFIWFPYIVCFNPRPSCEGRRALLDGETITREFQSTPLMRGATSIVKCGVVTAHCFNPRPSCEGRRGSSSVVVSRFLFQSTPLMRGATYALCLSFSRVRFQSTPLMRGATAFDFAVAQGTVVSIHAPHARGDMVRPLRRASERFQSTPLMRGATACRICPGRSA